MAYGAAKEEVLKLQGQAKMVGEVLDKTGEKLLTTGKELNMNVNNMSYAVINQMSNTTANAMDTTRNVLKKGDRFLQQIADGDLD